MINWIKKKLGIYDLELAVTCQHKSIGRIEKKLGKLRAGKQPLRHDEVERAKKKTEKRVT